MSDDKKEQGAQRGSSEVVSRRRLAYAAPAFILSRHMFYRQAPCNKQPGASLECDFRNSGS